MARKLYFIESIHTRPESEEQVVEVNMTPVESEEVWIPEFFIFNRQEFRIDTPGDIQDGQYVFYDNEAGDGEPVFTDGTYSLVAQRELGRSIYLRATLLQRAEAVKDAVMLDERKLSYDDAKVTSYHVNVGHGNCSFILIKPKEGYRLWMVDCSIFEMPNKVISHRESHVSEFENTLAYGLKYLIEKGYVDSKTIFYINLHYQMPSRYLNDIWQLMINKGLSSIIEPVHFNTSHCIHILHPECRIYKDKTSILEQATVSRFASNPNNSSSIYALKLAGKTMVFPGDLENEGFDAMTEAGTCLMDWRQINFYAASHHCSINGLPYRHCKRLIKRYNPLLCFRRKLKLTVVMGRDGAYKGIYSGYAKYVYWLQSLKGVFYTDDLVIQRPLPSQITTFVEVDWNGENAYNT